MSRWKFSKPGQVRRKFIESIFVQPLQMTQTQKNNNLYGFEILQMDIGGCVWLGGKFLKEWQVTDKVIESYFLQFIFLFYKWLKLKE